MDQMMIHGWVIYCNRTYTGDIKKGLNGIKGVEWDMMEINDKGYIVLKIKLRINEDDN